MKWEDAKRRFVMEVGEVGDFEVRVTPGMSPGTEMTFNWIGGEYSSEDLEKLLDVLHDGSKGPTTIKKDIVIG